eukprot:TRINITY_DN26216_c0_g1_i1.p1 TRINITY_DN26216_c0_g1~~TRINITY_DN26216_c0_g1_i1.p1  ORF type:complete len:521 (-),score=150.38 TRINITY_DN26216_c0_g1_i1:205-1767(-)
MLASRLARGVVVAAQRGRVSSSASSTASLRRTPFRAHQRCSFNTSVVRAHKNYYGVVSCLPSVKAFESSSFGRRSCERMFSSEVEAIVQFNLADVGEGIAECEVLKWHVKEGDQIEQFDPLCEVQSDKATVEITSRYEGVVEKVHYEVGDMAKVGSPLVDIRTMIEEESPEADAAGSGMPPPSADADEAQQRSRSASAIATPAVRRIARENDVDLSQIAGTGKDGRVTKTDILSFISSGGTSGAASPPAAARLGVPRAPAAAAPVETPSAPSGPKQVHIPPPSQGTAPDVTVPVRGIQKIMVQTMTAATSVPHFGYADEIVMDELMAVRGEMKQTALERGVRLSYMPFILKATSLALRAFPILNSHTNSDCTEYTMKGEHNIGVAMDTAQGLIVPNIKSVQNLSVLDIASELNRLQELGKEGKIPTADLKGGTFTISNIGIIGGTYLSPVLSLPEVAIGAIGKTQRVPRFDDEDNVVPVNIMNVSWSADHRVIDGATMASFSNVWKAYLENPSKMLLELR